VVAPHAAHLDRLTQAIIAKAVRIYVMAEAPLGTHGEWTEFGVARVMPDHQISELLFGLMFEHFPEDLSTLVTAEDVIRHLGYDEFPEAKEDDVERAISAAASWVDRWMTDSPVAFF
jgi:hypothetical protein